MRNASQSDAKRITKSERRAEREDELVEGGMSQREAAKAQGVSQSTVRDDVSRKSSKSSRNQQPKPSRRAEREARRRWG
jgi:transposase